MSDSPPPAAPQTATEPPLIDRAAHLRDEPDELAALLAHPDSVVVPHWRNRCLIARTDPPSPALLEVEVCGDLIEGAPEVIFLGLLEGRACFALAVDPDQASLEHPALAGQGDFTDLRLAGVTLPRRQAELLAYARGLLYWHKHHRFCPECGGATEVTQGGHQRQCTACDKPQFPRNDPAIMALVVHRDRCLLARQPGFPKAMFSVLAGFVEHGESIEDAVRREVLEEVGLAVTDLRYLRSQPWPFPSSLMIGFVMRSHSPDFRLDEQELEEARWFSRAELQEPEGFYVPPPYSLARQLIDHFMAAAN